MTCKLNNLVVHDTMYELNAPYRAGALAFRSSIPWDRNPHRDGSAAHDAWEYGHVNESAGEHFRFDTDVLSERRNGRTFEMDPKVPRTVDADPDDDWVRQQRARLAKAR